MGTRQPLAHMLVSDLLPEQGKSLLPFSHCSWRNYNLALFLVGINFQCGEFTNEFMRS